MSFFSFIKVVSYLPVALLWPTKVYGKENYIDGQSIVCCNHLASADVIILAHKFAHGQCRCVAKDELFRSRFAAWFLRKCGAISIRRGESDLVAFRSIMNVLKGGDQLFVFPEGTRNQTGSMQLQPLQPGAATFAHKADCAIIPMMLHRKPRAFRRNYLIIGQPITMDAFRDMPPKEARTALTQHLADTMQALQAQLNDMVPPRLRR